MLGGKSLTVNMGAYEFYVNDLTRGPNPDQTTFTSSSLPDHTYSIFYSDNLFTRRLAIESIPSFGNTTTCWTGDGSPHGRSAFPRPEALLRILENP